MRVLALAIAIVFLASPASGEIYSCGSSYVTLKVRNPAPSERQRHPFVIFTVRKDSIFLITAPLYHRHEEWVKVYLTSPAPRGFDIHPDLFEPLIDCLD